MLFVLLRHQISVWSSMEGELSTKGIFVSSSGAIAQSLKLDTIANNLANVSTPGFKRDQQTFKEYLTANEKPSDVMQVPRIPASVESFYDMQGGDKSYVDQAGTYTDFSQGTLRASGNPLDIAIDGKGFFEVDTPQGLRMTRNGEFKIDSGGKLVTKDGYPVLRAAPAGTEPSERVIQITGQGALQIAENGDLFEGGNPLGKLSLIDVVNKDSLHKVGHGLYTFKQNMRPEVTDLQNPSLKQGFVELSNVNVVQEMTDMITTTRLFESNQKAIQAYDSMNEKLINVVGSVK